MLFARAGCDICEQSPPIEANIGAWIFRLWPALQRWVPRLLPWLGSGKDVIRGPAGQISRAALEAAVKSGGPTTSVVTRLTQAPQLGRDLSVATGPGAEQLALAMRPTGQLFSAEIPNRLLMLLERAGLAIRSTTTNVAGDVIAQEIKFLPEASEFIVPFFR
jgi:hypothetical protein